MAGIATDKVKITAAERRQKVIELRKAGGSYRAIGIQVGVSAEQVRRDLNQALAGLQQEENGATAQMRQLESERLDSLTLAFWKGAIEQKDPDAANIVLKCMDRRAKLYGLDKPEQLQISQTGGSGPDWALIQQALMVALQAYPEARAAVAAGLVQLEALTTIEGEVSPSL